MSTYIFLHFAFYECVLRNGALNAHRTFCLVFVNANLRKAKYM